MDVLGQWMVLISLPFAINDLVRHAIATLRLQTIERLGRFCASAFQHCTHQPDQPGPEFLHEGIEPRDPG